MPVSASFAFRPLAIAGLALLLLVPVSADAQSRRDREAAAALQQRMEAAETRYRDALVRVRNNEPEAVAESDAALEDMEDVMVECGGLRGCDPAGFVTTFKRLLKAEADEAGAGAGEDIDPFDPDPDGMLAASVGADVPEAARAAALLSDGQRFVEMVQFNPAVQEGIRRWLTDMRVSLITSHENYQYMRHLMAPAFEKRGLPEALLFGIMAKESNGRVHAGSRAGAVGPLQFMPATGRRFGLGPDGTGFDTRYDPAQSADAAAAYLSERFAEFGNEVEKWLAAYNGGEGRAKRIHDASGGRQFWDADVYSQFPAETRDYVPMVIAAAWLYLHPREYGLSFPKIDVRPTNFVLARPASIYELTVCMGDSGSRNGYMRQLRNLNPRFEADQVIPAGAVLQGTTRMAALYKRWCAQGRRADLAHQLMGSRTDSALVRTGPIEVLPASGPVTVATGVPTRTSAPRQHRVARGDTLASISRRYGCDSKRLAQANGLKAPAYAIRTGQQLRLEGCSR